jgi:GT2 family glycosyltransferase
MIELSVVIPTYNRLATLRRCLAALDAQTLERDRYEIILVDDGSTDGTREEMVNRTGIRFIMQPKNGGPAIARNTGVRAAQGTWILFMGDDIIAPPTFLAQHLQAHAEVPGEHVTVLGYTPWGKDQPVSPLMNYLFDGRSFQQFRYHAITDPDQVPYKFFYTCNLSVNRNFMLRYGLFDEEFRHAYGEDTELAYRLARHGLRIIYRREIVADHYHLTSYRNARKRARLAGEVATLMARKHPELSNLSFLPFPLKGRIINRIRRTLTETILDPLLDYADRQHWDHPLIAKAYDWALRKHQLWGLMDTVERQGIVTRQPAAGRAA